jgi:hypothetical protein
MAAKNEKIHSIICLSIPAIFYLVTFSGFELETIVKFFLPNYLYFVTPMLVWIVLGKIGGFSWSYINVGMVSVLLIFAGLNISFACCINNDNALGWLYYWPLAIIGSMLITFFVGMIHFFTIKP